MSSCPECSRNYTDLQLLKRDLEQANEELNYARQQTQQAQNLAQKAQEEARGLALRLETAQRAGGRPRDLKEILADPAMAAKLPEVLDKDQALAIARRHLPALFEPVTLKF